MHYSERPFSHRFEILVANKNEIAYHFDGVVPNFHAPESVTLPGDNDDDDAKTIPAF